MISMFATQNSLKNVLMLDANAEQHTKSVAISRIYAQYFCIRIIEMVRSNYSVFRPTSIKFATYLIIYVLYLVQSGLTRKSSAVVSVLEDMYS